MLQIRPKLTVITGGMFSGKTSELLRQGHRHELRGQEVIFIKPDYDKRYDKYDIVSHNGFRHKALTVSRFEDFSKMVLPPERSGIEVVLIDEIQFFNEVLLTGVDRLLKQGLIVYCAGLDLDCSGSPFGMTPALMAMADEVIKLHAVCDNCGADAWVTPRKKEFKEILQLGEKDNYFPVCRLCFYQLKR